MSKLLIYSLILFVTSVVASAQSSINTSTLRVDEAKTPSPIKREGEAEFELKRSEFFSYSAPEYRGDAASQNNSIGLRFKQSIERGVFTGKVAAKDTYSITEKWNYADVHELYVGTKGAHTEFYAGRKLETWSAWDEEWQQGAFQPRYMENRMRMEQAGLMGFFFGAGAGPFKATLGVFPINIPDFGPHFYVENDRFTSKNPWFHPPVSRFNIGNGTGDIHYTLNEPPASDVIRHGGGALKMEYKDNSYLARATGAYKPMTGFVLAFPSHGKFKTGPDEDHFEIEVNPRVVYDRIVSLDNLYRQGPWSFSGSVAYSNPDDQGTPSDWTRQEIRSATIWSAAVERQLEEGPQAARVRLGFLKIHGGDAQDSGPFAGQSSLFDRRYQFYEAYSLGVAKDIRGLFRNPLENEIRVIYDRMQGGGMITFNSGVALSKSLRAEVEADFIGLLTSTAQIPDGFIEEYRANDRFSLGVSYVF